MEDKDYYIEMRNGKPFRVKKLTGKSAELRDKWIEDRAKWNGGIGLAILSYLSNGNIS